jgi:hypothetical protein
MAAGILGYIISVLHQGQGENTRIEIIPLEPDQRSYLRREAPSVIHKLRSSYSRGSDDCTDFF